MRPIVVRPADNDVRAEHRAGSDRHASANHAIRTIDVIRDFGRGIDHCGRIAGRELNDPMWLSLPALLVLVAIRAHKLGLGDQCAVTSARVLNLPMPRITRIISTSSRS